MRRIQFVLAVMFLGCIWASATPFTAFAAPPLLCLPPHRLSVLNLGMIPDPVRQGQRIQLWTVKLRSDWNGECVTFLEVRDRNQIAGKKVQYLIKPGEGRYALPAEPSYFFQGRDSCFTVYVNVTNTWAPVAAARTFCAQLGPGGWSLR